MDGITRWVGLGGQVCCFGWCLGYSHTTSEHSGGRDMGDSSRIFTRGIASRARYACDANEKCCVFFGKNAIRRSNEKGEKMYERVE